MKDFAVYFSLTMKVHTLFLKALVLFEDKYFALGKHTAKSAKFTSLENYRVYGIQ